VTTVRRLLWQGLDEPRMEIAYLVVHYPGLARRVGELDENPR
jgi:hypothetical protein